MSVPTSSAQWSSRLGFILAAAGSAIGLGAIWKFPYWAGANGGAAFILPYILFTFTAGVVLVMAELALGRSGRGSAVEAMRRAGGRGFAWCGGMAVLTSFLILSYYAVVGGWCAAYLAEALMGEAASPDPEVLKMRFGELGRAQYCLAFCLFGCRLLDHCLWCSPRHRAAVHLPDADLLPLDDWTRRLFTPAARIGGRTRISLSVFLVDRNTASHLERHGLHVLFAVSGRRRSRHLRRLCQ